MFHFHKNVDQDDSPTLSVSIRVKEIYSNSVALTWIVENSSEQCVTFDENQIMLVELNGRSILYPTEATALDVGEKVSIDLNLINIDTEKTNEIKITAASNEGTKATIRKTIYPSQQDVGSQK